MFTLRDFRIDANCLKQVEDFLGIDDGIIASAEVDNSFSGYKIIERDGKAYITYALPQDLFCSLTFISVYGARSVIKERNFENMGYMADVARNAVPKIPVLKKLVLYLAAFGFNRLYIYLEDLFEVENEPFFGYLRGRYTLNELKELDDYCSGFGIELIPCLQTLAHLNAIFKWGEYEKCLDVNDILLIGDERTYKLIDNMFKTVASTFRSKNLHIGMDEAHMVGRGRYLDVNGYKPAYETMAEHAEKVINMAKRYGFKPSMWSDMYFRFAFGGGYYSADGVLPDEVKKQIPKDVELVYWDYFNRDKTIISHMAKEHLKTGNKVVFAGGAWKWTGFNPSTELSFLTSKTALKVCRENGIKNVMLTAWADDGAEASLFSTLPVMAYYSESAYGEATENAVDLILKKVFGVPLQSFYAADMPLISKKQFECNYLLGKLPKILLYNDVLSGCYDGIIKNYNIKKEIGIYKRKLKKAAESAPEDFAYIFDNLYKLCKVLEIKADLGLIIRKAYKQKDLAVLSEIEKKKIPLLIKNIKEFERGFFYAWTLENKDNGYQTHDLRLGGLVKRLQTVKILLRDYVDGKIPEIFELNDEVLNIEGETALNMLLWKDWKYIHSVYVV